MRVCVLRERDGTYCSLPQYSPPPLWNKFRKLCCLLIPGCSLPSVAADEARAFYFALPKGIKVGSPFSTSPPGVTESEWGDPPSPLVLPGVLTPEGGSSLGSWNRKEGFSSPPSVLTPEGGINSLCPASLERRDRKEWFPLTRHFSWGSPRGAGTEGCWLCPLCSFRSSFSPLGPRSRCCRRPP